MFKTKQTLSLFFVWYVKSKNIILNRGDINAKEIAKSFC